MAVCGGVCRCVEVWGVGGARDWSGYCGEVEGSDGKQYGIDVEFHLPFTVLLGNKYIRDNVFRFRGVET